MMLTCRRGGYSRSAVHTIHGRDSSQWFTHPNTAGNRHTPLHGRAGASMLAALEAHQKCRTIVVTSESPPGAAGTAVRASQPRGTRAHIPRTWLGVQAPRMGSRVICEGYDRYGPAYTGTDGAGLAHGGFYPPASLWVGLSGAVVQAHIAG